MKAKTDLFLFLLSLGLIAAAVFFSYRGILDGEFVYDDPLLIHDSPLVADPEASMWDAFSQPYFGAGGQGVGFYRPLMTLLFRLEYKLFEAEAWGFHLDNLLIHLGACWTLFGLFVLLGACRPWALAGALLMAVHPVTTESVAWISGRTDPLALLFMLLSLIFLVGFLRTRQEGRIKHQRQWMITLSLISFIAALLTKEIAYLLPVAVLLVLFAADRDEMGFEEKPAKSVWLIFGTFVGLAVLLFILASALPQTDDAELYSGRGTGWERGLTFLALLPAYLAKLCWPFDLNIAHPVVLINEVINPFVGAGLLILLMGILLFILALRKRSLMPALGLSFFLLALLAVSNTVFPIYYGLREMDFPFFERYLYIPLAGLLTVFTSLAPRRPGRFIAFAPLILVLCLCPFLGTVTKARSNEWRDNVSLFLVGVERFPESPSLTFNLGQAFMEAGKFREARSAFYSAYHLDESLDMARVQEAVALAGYSDVEDGVALLEEILDADPENGQAWEAMGFIYGRAGQWLDAYEAYSRALPLVGHDPITRSSRDLAAKGVKAELETLFLEKKDFEAVLERADRVLAWYPQCTWALEARGLALYEMGKEKEAKKTFEACLRSAEIPPVRAMAALIEIYEREGQAEKAEALRIELAKIKELQGEE
ncbi:MAG: tetratricopeptide repeat protein [Planctomycetota bacterium]|jgi:tetratricopeptide (TPR) repeat protein